MKTYRREKLAAEPKCVRGWRTVKAGTHRVRIALLPGGKTLATSILHPRREHMARKAKPNPYSKATEARLVREMKAAYRAYEKALDAETKAEERAHKALDKSQAASRKYREYLEQS